MSTVIGVHDGHNASVAVVRDGRVEFALQEERITRVKNQGDVPKNALAAALRDAGTGARVALNGRYMNYGQWGRETILEDYGRSSNVVSRMKQPFKDTFVDRAYQRRKAALREERLGEVGIGSERLEVVEHHLAHASAAYYTCPWAGEPVLVVTCDGSGDRVCATVSIGDRGKLTRLAQISEHDSIGQVVRAGDAVFGDGSAGARIQGDGAGAVCRFGSEDGGGGGVVCAAVRIYARSVGLAAAARGAVDVCGCSVLGARAQGATLRFDCCGSAAVHRRLAGYLGAECHSRDRNFESRLRAAGSS